MNHKVQYKNILSITSEGKNAGKTMLACDIIAKFSLDYDIIGIKMTPHQHNDKGKAELIESEKEILIFKETDPFGTKDTSKMLGAGAVEAYLIQLGDTKFTKALSLLENMIEWNTLIVCESGRIPYEIKPGISLFVRQLSNQVSNLNKKIPAKEIDRIVKYTNNGFDFDLNQIIIDNKTWKLQNK